ncbi:MAG: helix-turn-helix domain-containing protein [Armatimonadota bacterium]
MPCLLQLLVAQACQALNVADLSRETGIPQSTLQRYLLSWGGQSLPFGEG